MNILLTIAGFDPTAGAGLMRDAAVFKDLGFYPMAVPSCNTAQNTREFAGMTAADLDIFKRSLQLIDQEGEIAGIKIGMIPSYDHAKIIYDYISNRDLPIVYDPVGKTTTGGGKSSDWNRMVELLSEEVSLLTPNKGELEELEDQPSCPILITGIAKGRDRLLVKGQAIEIESKEVDVREHHGSGCTLSSAILANLVRTQDLKESIVQAKAYMVKKLAEDSSLGRDQALFL